MSIKEGYAYCLNVLAMCSKKEYKIIDVFVIYDSTAPKLRKLGLHPSQIIITFIALHS